MGNSYWGKILEVDLTNRKFSQITYDDAHAQKYLGGLGLAMKIIFDRMPQAGTDPLAPDNILFVGTGLLGGTAFPGQKTGFYSKSPLTVDLGIGRSQMGGAFAPEIKMAGWDGIVFTGKASNPVYLNVTNEDVELKDASAYWGKDAQMTEHMIKQAEDDEFVRVVSIGPAGENLVRFASWQTELGRAAARTGMGAVAGSKNLKAVAVRGTQTVPLADHAGFNEHMKQVRYALTRARGLWPFQKMFTRKHTCSYGGPCSYKNFSESGNILEQVKINTERQEKEFYVRYACCPTFCDGACFSLGVIRQGPYTGIAGEGSEYDTGPTILGTGQTDVKASMAAIAMLDKLGMDGSSCGNTMAWAMECYERGLLTTEDTGGLELNWGDGDLLIKLLKLIAFRQGFGDILAEGSMRAATYLEEQKGLEPGTLLQYACQHRGLEMANVEVRYGYSAGIAGTITHATSARGSGDHLTDREAARDALGVCFFCTDFRGMSIDDLAKAVALATGWDYTADTYLADQERLTTLQRALWTRWAWPTTPAEVDYVPPKFYVEPMKFGAFTGMVLDKAKFEEERAKYYEARGWDERGLPTKATFSNLGLDDIADKMVEAGVTLT